MRPFDDQSRSRRLGLWLVLGAIFASQTLNLGCATVQRVFPSGCSSRVLDAVTRQATTFSWGAEPFPSTPGGNELRVCGSAPTAAEAEGLWNGIMLSRLAEVCDPAHPQHLLYRDRFCPASRWCVTPTSTVCNANQPTTTDCTPPAASPMSLPPCPDPPSGMDPRLCADSLTVTFPATAVGATSTATLTVRHCGGGQLLVRHPRDWIFNAAMDSRPSFDDAALEPTWDCDPLNPTETMAGGALLGPDTTRMVCTVTLRFRPETAGAKTAQLFITSNDPRQPMLPVTLTGTGENVAAGLSILGTRSPCGSPRRTICFDDTHTTPSPPGACRERTISISASGGPVTLRRLRPSITADPEWQDISGLTYPQAIPNGESRTLRLRHCVIATPVNINLQIQLETDDTCATYPLLLDTTPGCAGP